MKTRSSRKRKRVVEEKAEGEDEEELKEVKELGKSVLEEEIEEITPVKKKRNRSTQRRSKRLAENGDNGGGGNVRRELDMNTEEIEDATPVKKKRKKSTKRKSKKRPRPMMMDIDRGDESDFEPAKLYGPKKEKDLIEVEQFGSDSDREGGHGSNDDKNLDQGLNIPWVEKYLPQKLEDIAGNKSKLGVMRDWLQTVLTKNKAQVPRFLILTGPTGAGKSTAVRVLAEEMDLELVEWGGQGRRFYELETFLKGIRYPSLVNESKERLVLVDDLPAISDEERKSQLQDLLLNAATFTQSPVVLALTDHGHGTASIKRILGEKLLSSAFTYEIQFKVVTDAAIRKRLKDIAKNECLKIPGKDLELIVSSCGGDIRSAVMSLQLYTTTSSVSLQNGHSQKSNKKKRRTPTLSDNSFLGKDASLETFYAVSKILNNKRLKSGLSKYNVESLLSDCATEPSTFMSFLHQNYSDFFADTDDIAAALDCLSFSDTLLPWQQSQLSLSMLHECASSVACRGCLYYNRHPIQDKWRPIRGPRAFSIHSARSEYMEDARCKMQVQGYSGVDLRTRTYMTEFHPFLTAVSRKSGKSVTFAERRNSQSSPSVSQSQHMYDSAYDASQAGGNGANDQTASQAMLANQAHEAEELSQRALINGIEAIHVTGDDSELQDDVILDWD